MFANGAQVAGAHMMESLVDTFFGTSMLMTGAPSDRPGAPCRPAAQPYPTLRVR
jgi:hypothetical protein